MSSRYVVRLVIGTVTALVALLATLVPAAAVPPTQRPGPPAHVAGPPGDSMGIEVLSSRPEYVSGGDARIAVSFPRTVPPHQVELLLDGEPVDAELREVDGVLAGIVDGLPLGTSVLEARANGRGKGRPAPASVEITNHPRMGPMFSGPHQTPFYCQTEAFGLGPALDDDCDAPTRVEFKYVTTAGAVADLPAGLLPADLATTTTTTGDTVDFILRVETGVINRAVYETAVLYDPDISETDAPGATRGWNDRIIYTYGGGCNAAYAQGGNTAGVVRPDLLGKGYAVASSSLNVLNNECNDVVSAETTSMVKEEFIERYGVDDHTIGLGGSGGAISQYLIAHNYPGLIDGLVTTAMFPDAASILPGVADCGAMFRYFSSDASGLWDEASRTAVSGYPSFSLHCVSWALSFANRLDATTACNPIVPAETWYDPDDNPDGVRCSTAANAVNVLGVDPVTGLAPSGFANEGVQYGLRSLLAGDVSAEQFLAVNEGIGGFDEDGLPQPARTSPDAAIDAYYSGGRVVTGTGLANVPIVTVRDWRDAQRDIHTHYYTFNLQERLLRDNGTAENMVIQVYDGQVPSGVRASAVPEAIATVDDWLAGLDEDVESRTIEEVVAARPADARNGCWTASGDFVEQPITFANQGTCGDIYPSSAESRWEAGGPVTGDILACALRPLDRGDYADGTFTDDQWGRMQALFATGVCDWTKPGIGQVGWDGPWQDYSG